MKTSKLIMILGFFTFLPGIILQAQNYEDEGDILSRLKGENELFSNFRVEVDSMIETNYYKHILYNKKNAKTMGFRIRIFSGSGNNAFSMANQNRARFLSKYEDINAYISYDAPDYKVYVGDCRTHSDALKLFEKIREDFPYAFIVEYPIDIKAVN
ncbi:MAG: hypothetical protein ACOCZL_01515 [Bacteroidota bacterium]